MIDHSDSCPSGTAVVVFARAPASDRAKTRLAREVGGRRAGAIYQWLLNRSLALRTATGPSDLDWYVFVDSSSGRPWFRGNAPGWDIRVQSSGDLGARLADAFQRLFCVGYANVLIVGSDIPDLRPMHLSRTTSLLRTHPAVLGPTHDGGYYLIGQRAPGVPLFSDVGWGGTDVYRQTIRLARAAGVAVGRLPPLHDIDTWTDWQSFVIRSAYQGKAFRSPSFTLRLTKPVSPP